MGRKESNKTKQISLSNLVNSVFAAFQPVFNGYQGTVTEDAMWKGINIYLVNQGSQVRFEASPSPSDETFSRCPVFLDTLKPEPLPVEPPGVPGHNKITKP